MGNMDENAEIKLVEKGFITDSNEEQKRIPAGQGGSYGRTFKPNNVNQVKERISSDYINDRRNYMELKIDMWNRKKINEEIPRPIMLGFPEIAQNQEWQVDKYFLGDHARKSVRPTKDWDELQYIACSNGVHHVIGNGKIVLVCSIQIKK